MAEKIEFTSNYNDLCNDNGYQFEFYCDRCGTGYRSSFKASLAGTAENVLDAASSLFGGFFGSAANITQRARSASWSQARDKAFVEAMAELKPSFVQCPRCQSWVCREKCWNTKKGLCKNCAPDLGVEMSAAQASKSVEEVWAHAAMAEEDKKLGLKEWRQNIRASCPQCEAPLAANVKFCPECGAKLATEKHCTNCGVKLPATAKFCAECGTKQE